MLPFFNIRDSRNVLKYLFGVNPPLPAAAQHPTASSDEVAFTFGLVADVQMARMPTARGVKQTVINGKRVNVRRRRAWSESIPKLSHVAAACNKAGVDFVVSLGDVIEGYGIGNERNEEDFEQVVRVFERFTMHVFHVIGNHCRQIPLQTLTQSLKMEAPYYTFSPFKGWRFIILHTAELYAGAVDTLKEDCKLLDEIVKQNEREKHHFHGAMSEVQLNWLANQLSAASRRREKVVILSHYPLAKGSARLSHVLANSTFARQLIEHEHSPVIACLAGHDHMGGSLHVRTASNKPVSYITIPALLECPPHSTAHAIVTCYTNGTMHISGRGSVPSYTIPHPEGL